MKTGHNYYVYIVRCADGLYYTGVTNDLEKVVLSMYEEKFNNINNAIAWEKQVKG